MLCFQSISSTRASTCRLWIRCCFFGPPTAPRFSCSNSAAACGVSTARACVRCSTSSASTARSFATTGGFERCWAALAKTSPARFKMAFHFCLPAATWNSIAWRQALCLPILRRRCPPDGPRALTNSGAWQSGERVRRSECSWLKRALRLTTSTRTIPRGPICGGRPGYRWQQPGLVKWRCCAGAVGCYTFWILTALQLTSGCSSSQRRTPPRFH